MVGTYIMFQGNCAAALHCYERAFHIRITELQRYGDMPPSEGFPVSEAERDKVLHGKFILDGAEIMCADSSEPPQAGDNMFISITTADDALAVHAWDILKEGGTVYHDLQPSFFALRHGSLRDQFGVNWMFTVRGTP